MFDSEQDESLKVARSCGNKFQGELSHDVQAEQPGTLSPKMLGFHSRSNEQQKNVIFYDGSCQAWIHRRCSGLTRLAFENNYLVNSMQVGLLLSYVPFGYPWVSCERSSLANVGDQVMFRSTPNAEQSSSHTRYLTYRYSSRWPWYSSSNWDCKKWFAGNAIYNAHRKAN